MLKQIHNRVFASLLQVRLQLYAQFCIGTLADADFYRVILRPNRISSRFFWPLFIKADNFTTDGFFCLFSGFGRFFNRSVCSKKILPMLEYDFRKVTAFDQVHALYTSRII